MKDLNKTDDEQGGYDLIVLGAGSAGFSAAITGADAGKRVALVGHGTIGGTCVNVGCVPSKAMIRAAESYESVEPMNVSTSGGLSIKELAMTIKGIVGFEGDIVYDSTKPDGALMKTFSNERIRSALGWEPTTSLEDGIRETLDWFIANQETIEQESP